MGKSDEKKLIGFMAKMVVGDLRNVFFIFSCNLKGEYFVETESGMDS